MRRHALVVALLANLWGGCGDSEPTPQNTVSDLVTAARYTRLVFEVDSVDGAAPAAGALDEVTGELDTLRAAGLLGKPDGVAYVLDDTLAPRGPGHAWTFDELVALAEETRSLPVAANEVRVHVLSVDGHSADDEGGAQILGWAWGHDLIVLFRDSVHAGCEAAAPRARPLACRLADGSVLLHETGHVLGLVNNGLPMSSPHQDAEHGAHDVNEDCIMHYEADSSSLLPMLLDRVGRGLDSVSPFDAACLGDLAALQGIAVPQNPEDRDTTFNPAGEPQGGDR